MREPPAGIVALIFSLPEGGLTGPLLALGAAVAVALYYVAQLWAQDIDPAVAATWTAVGAGLALSRAGIATSSAVPPAALWTAAGAVLVASSLPVLVAAPGPQRPTLE